MLLTLAAANLAAWLILLFLGRSSLRSAFTGLGRWPWLFLAGLVLAQAAVHVLFVGPKHLVFIDEFWYMQAGKNLLGLGHAPGYAKSIGWPFLISLSYLAGGIDNFSAIRLSTLLGCLVPVNLFLAGWLLTEDRRAAAVAALFMAFVPHHLVWSATAETAAASLFFVTASVWASLAYYRSGAPGLLRLALASWAMSVQVRPENLFLMALFGAGIPLLVRPRPRPDAGFLLAWLAAAAVCLPNILVYAGFQSSAQWLAVDSGGGAAGANFSLNSLLSNTARWAPAFLDGTLHPVLFTLAAAAGAWDMAVKRRWSAVILFAWIGTLYLFYFSSWLRFYGGTEALFPKTKLFSFFYPALCVLAARGCLLPAAAKPWGGWAAAALILAVLAGFGVRAAGAPLRAAPEELEARMVSELRQGVPADCVVLANAPVIVDCVGSARTAATEDFLASEEVRRLVFGVSGCVLLLKDITDEKAREYGRPEFATAFSRMSERFRLDERAVFSLREKSYRLYGVRPKRP
ncbi:MAG: glycosyltransferase family 39 protein [Elusimicrobiota bacterium]|jgi:hypothetical protein